MILLTRSHYVECSRSPLDLESRHAEASSPRARLFWRVSSDLISLQSFRSLHSPELRWGSCVSGRWASSHNAQRMECSRSPLDLESRHAEASAPRARLFRRVSSDLISLQSFRSLHSTELRWGSCVRASSHNAQRMECSRSPLDLESYHAEASAPRARLFWWVSSDLISLQSFSCLRSPELRWGSCVSGRWASSHNAQRMECSRSPLDLESYHA